jgi:peptide deformylase
VSIEVSALSLIKYPDPRLRRKCQLVTVFDDDFRMLTARMFEIMRESRGVGLAAPQVGVPLRVFVMNVMGKPEGDCVVANPTIHDGSAVREAEEGCLSIPDVFAKIRRPSRCRLTAFDELGRPFEREGEGLLARCWQHETDHLDGVLILDRMGPSDEIATRKVLRELEAAYRERGGK